MTDRGNFLYHSLSTSLKYDLWQLWALSKTLKYELWQLWAIYITILYQNHWNISYDCYGPFPLQFHIKIIEMWPMTAICHFHYNSLSKSLKYDLWQLWTISITIPYQNHWAISLTIHYQNHWNMHYDSYGPFHYNSLSKSLKYYLWWLWAIAP